MSNPKQVKRFITYAQYFPTIFLWILVPQLAWIAGSGKLDLTPIPNTLLIITLVMSGVISSIKELPFRFKLIPTLMIVAYGFLVALNYRETEYLAAAGLALTYLLAVSVASLIIWYLFPVLAEMLETTIEVNRKVGEVSQQLTLLDKANHDSGTNRSISG